MSLVTGADMVFYLFNGVTFKPYMCARSQDDSLNTDSIETTGPGDGNFRTFEPTVHSFDKNLDGVTSLNEAAGLTLPELRVMQLAKTIFLGRTIYTAQDGTQYAEEGNYFITNSTPTGSFDGIATFRIALKGTGALTPIITPPTPPSGSDMRYPAQGVTAPPTTGSYTWSTGLTGKYLLNVVKDGRGSSNIILSGTPVGNEVLYDSTTGDLTWAIPFEDGETPPYVEYRDV